MRNALAKLAGETGRVEDAARVKEGDNVWYRAEIDRRDQADLKVKATAEGTILEQVEESDD